ncbi:GTP:AMP phosphotransferase AK3, mitochondrial [Cryptotermes secundus]|uniref:GTP:AMP phosphotransferase, mitochondrial n=1 Tax=Cryptotermes secundus TaxID=105785 RepID=A0A2J7PP94_9NEOP|nr:GTP:AMP phosphotransferase AK3, mitochondrial isoform X1 [Cryptotermes secundus]PNF18126.1 GTP:AMP phosphotransferase AK3, mitochondrial [Cryptotermes secundus]
MIKAFKAVIIGAPASGKGTISSRIIKYFEVKHVSSGDILRSHMSRNTDFGLKVKQYVNKGHLVPDELMISLIKSELGLLKNNNWLLDGFPRTREQAEELYTKEPIDVALNLIVPFEIIIERVKGRWIHEPSGRIYNTEYSPPKITGKDDVTGEELIQRPDDQPEAVRKRLEVYSDSINPVLDFYRKKGILQDFKGNTSDEIWPLVYNFLKKYMVPKAELH